MEIILVVLVSFSFYWSVIVHCELRYRDYLIHGHLQISAAMSVSENFAKHSIAAFGQRNAAVGLLR